MASETSERAYDLRKFALGEANKCVYIPGSMNSVGGNSGGFIAPATVVDRAQTYYDFLMGKK